MPRLAVLSVLSAASSPCPDLNLIHYITAYFLTNSLYNILTKEKGRLKTEFGFSDDLFAWGSESGERVASGLRLGMPFSVGVFFDGGTHAGSVAAVHEHDRFAVEGVAVAALIGDDRFVVVQL